GTWPEGLDPPSRSGGGELTNMGCYAIDYAVELLGRPRSGLAKRRQEWDVYRRADVENFGQIVLDYGDFFAMLEAGKQQLPAPSRHANALTITFEHRAIHIDTTARPVSLNHVPQDWDAFTRGARAVGSADRLIRALRDRISPGDDVGTIVDATEVLMAAYESSLQGGCPIALPLPRGDNPLTRSRRSTGANTESRSEQPGTGKTSNMFRARRWCARDGGRSRDSVPARCTAPSPRASRRCRSGGLAGHSNTCNLP